ncbi:MAG: 3'-5' exonuclease [Candidatus Omnitrophica bacterium]|nr:3'-5' exonuclease [Candidatus Omnitrophota bacterium]
MTFNNMEFVVFDVETTGLYPTKGDRIIELAAVKVKENKIVDTFDTFINPQREIPEESQKIHNITPDMLKEAPTHDEVLPNLVDFISGACLVAHNIKFDLDFVSHELSLMGRKLRQETPAVDTLKMSKKLCPYFRSHRLTYIAQSFGIRNDGAHRALNDVHMTIQIFYRLIDMAYDQGYHSYEQYFKDFSVLKPSFKIHQQNEVSLF